MRHAMLIVCGLGLLSYLGLVAGPMDMAEQLNIEAGEKIARPMRMPKAKPRFERPEQLLRFTPPVTCVRMSGITDMGREWIRQWGDGALPPMMPTCVNARRG